MTILRVDRNARPGRHLTDSHCPSRRWTPTNYRPLTGRQGWRRRLRASVLGSCWKPQIEHERPTLTELDLSLDALEPRSSRVRDFQPVAGVGQLKTWRPWAHSLAEVHSLSGLEGRSHNDLSGNAVEDLRELASPSWVHVSESRIGERARD